MAVESGNVTPRTRLPGGATEVDVKGTAPLSTIVTADEAGDFVQVPSTAPPMTAESQAGVGDEHKEHEEELEHTASDVELLQFDWEDLRQRYTKSLKEANEVEDALIEQFEQYSEAFTVWAQASAQRDNDRAQKRLKTRELFVQISERELDDKKVHYVNVVEAFKNALKLLQSPSTRH